MSKPCSKCGVVKPLEDFYKSKDSSDGHISSCRTCEHDRSNKKYRRLRALVFEQYGAACACCGESEFDFLTIDHINNDGYLHRRVGINGGVALYQWLKNNKFPPEYQVLCMNCNWSKFLNNGICIHQMSHVKN